jgi:hypothetical protein
MSCSAYRQRGQKPLMEMIQAFRSGKDITQLQIFVGQHQRGGERGYCLGDAIPGVEQTSQLLNCRL